jgi:ribosomal protein S18 acetylase RimI-like enzyme
MLTAPGELVSLAGTTGPGNNVELRGYRPEDLADLYDVCVRTGDSGEDATGKFARPELLGDIYVGPYVAREPGLAFVLEAAGRAVGYVLGTADTAGFVQWCLSSWIPRFGADHAEPAGAPATPDERLLSAFHHPERMWRPELAAYPAHLHIDILSPYQGAGWGRRLIEAFLAAVHAEGAAAVHLGVSAVNTRAQGFYRRLGFEQLGPGTGGGFTFVRSTSSD